MTFHSKTEFVAHHINRLLDYAAFGVVRPTTPTDYLSIAEFSHLIKLIPPIGERKQRLMDIQTTVKTLRSTLTDNVDDPQAWIPLRRELVELIASEFIRLAKLEADLVSLVEGSKTPSAAPLLKKGKAGRPPKQPEIANPTIVAVTDFHSNGFSSEPLAIQH